MLFAFALLFREIAGKHSSFWSQLFRRLLWTKKWFYFKLSDTLKNQIGRKLHEGTDRMEISSLQLGSIPGMDVRSSLSALCCNFPGVALKKNPTPEKVER